LDLVPTLIQSHRHGADKRFHASGGLLVGRTESAHLVLVVQHAHLEAKFLLQVLDNHDQKWQFDGQGLDFVNFMRAADPARGDVRGTDLNYR